MPLRKQRRPGRLCQDGPTSAGGKGRGVETGGVRSEFFASFSEECGIMGCQNMLPMLSGFFSRLLNSEQHWMLQLRLSARNSVV